MAQWVGRIAGQSVHFRGTSTVGVQDIATPGRVFSNRALSSAVYVARVTGGVSGSFGITVIGKLGSHGSAALPNPGIASGTTFALAGVTGIGAAGNFVLFPYNYGIDGKGVLGVTAGTGDLLYRIDQTLPPTNVAFESGVTTAGISAHCIVSALLYTA